MSEEVIRCPSCGSIDVQKAGFQTSFLEKKKRRWKCRTCYKTFLTDYKEAKIQVAQ